jgi:hypothetical protein
MKDRTQTALVILRWVVGLVLLLESARFAFSPAAARVFAATGMPNFVHLALAWCEMVASVIFLIPKTTNVGGRFLLIVLAFAILVHLLHGWFDVGALLVYATATWAVMTGIMPVTRPSGDFDSARG